MIIDDRNDSIILSGNLNWTSVEENSKGLRGEREREVEGEGKRIVKGKEKEVLTPRKNKIQKAFENWRLHRKVETGNWEAFYA